ncbi:hypothetical protein W97_06252 [Coniosporium apollinis CBS 100218]|uniref:GH16 domain-containing protein n=1 Tax=Coniosporium apollinis (strain CBS 100218) TaxID=1168221 RepID=R7YY26_CONA1|nr:uncharacterized protein W97_06252 [Coniosporium apollinis CBS 100218]EON66850.1 hypothetical protein W97_06252 [Coniosporium apollinis CBS 100218]
MRRFKDRLLSELQDAIQKPTQTDCPPPPPYWQPVFSPSLEVSQHFKHQLGDHGWGNNELQNYVASPQNSFHRNGKLVLRAIADSSAPRDKYTSARLTSHQTLGRQRGYLTATITAPCASGIWPALWLLPSEPFKWPEDGEVDIFESWNGDYMNHSCLHWGHYNGQDHDKHRACETRMPHMSHAEGCTFALAWEQPEDGQGGRMVWYIDGRAVMKATIPQGTRRMEDWQVIINVAMGGNVTQGQIPRDGSYEFVVHSISLHEEPSGGWAKFERDWRSAKEGHTM